MVELDSSRLSLVLALYNAFVQYCSTRYVSIFTNTQWPHNAFHENIASFSHFAIPNLCNPAFQTRLLAFKSQIRSVSPLLPLFLFSSFLPSYSLSLSMAWLTFANVATSSLIRPVFRNSSWSHSLLGSATRLAISIALIAVSRLSKKEAVCRTERYVRMISGTYARFRLVMSGVSSAWVSAREGIRESKMVVMLSRSSLMGLVFTLGP